MSLTTTSIILTVVELFLLLLHISVFVCICRQIRRKVAPFTSSFFKIYSLRCLVDYAAYLMGCLLLRLWLVGIFPPPSELLGTLLTPLIMFVVFQQLFLYALVVVNRYTAIVQPFRHEIIWTGRRLALAIVLTILLSTAAAFLYELANYANGDVGVKFDLSKRQLVAFPVFVTSSVVCGTSVGVQARTAIIYRQMSVTVRLKLREEFLLLGYAILGLIMPIGLSCIFGIALFWDLRGAMHAFPYLVGYMSLCEPIWLLITSRPLRAAYARLYCCRAGTSATVVVRPAESIYQRKGSTHFVHIPNKA